MNRSSVHCIKKTMEGDRKEYPLTQTQYTAAKKKKKKTQALYLL